MKIFKKIIVLFSLVITISVCGQEPTPKNLDRVKSLKVAFLTDKLNLSSKEATKFWPIYNTYDEKIRILKMEEMRMMRKKVMAENGFDNLSEKEAKKLIDEQLLQRKKIYDLEVKLIEELTNVIPNIKIIKLQLAEQEFRRKLLGKLKNRRRN